jgi:hypothetical protein
MSIAALVGGMGFVGAASADVIVGTGTPTATTLGAATANAQQFSAGGIGHQLIVPYFNAQNGNATIISVTNTDTVNGKVLKVRFRGASNSDDILDFLVFMSPGDIWNATITSPATTSPAQIVTSDRTCTLPQLAVGVPQQFVTARLPAAKVDVPNMTREGYVEIFNTADIPPAAVRGTATESALFTAVKHVAGVPPCTSSAINAAGLNTNFVTATEAAAAGAGLATPTTGLYGNWTIINVPQTTTYSGSMTAVRAVVAATLQNGRGHFVLFPQSGSAYTGAIDTVTADPILRTSACTTKSFDGLTCTATGAAATAAAFFDLPDMSTPYVINPALGTAAAPLGQASALTASLEVFSIANDYATDAAITAKTDWVFSMPTRRYSVAMDYAPATSRQLFSIVGRLVGGVNMQYFYTGNTRLNPSNAQQICVDAQSQVFYDREETTKTSGAVFSPGAISVTSFCGEVSVLSFGDTGTSVLGASVARQDTGGSAFVNGWGLVNVTNPTTTLGLPVMGYSVIKATNPAVAAGQSGTYGITSEHRFR